jgi:uncharacterized protein
MATSARRFELPVLASPSDEPVVMPMHGLAPDPQPADQTPFSDVFCIPHEGQFIIYFPLRGTVLLGNAELVRMLYRARQGDRDALDALGASTELIEELFESRRELQRLSAPTGVPPFAPTTVTLFLTNDCTLRCKYCYAKGGETSSGKVSRRMPWEVVTGVLDEVIGNVVKARLPAVSVIFHGGGDVAAAWPLMQDTMGYLREQATARRLGVRTSMGMAGVLNPRQREWIIANIDTATVSLDGPADINDAQRPLPNGRGSYEYVRETLKAFDAAGFHYGIRTTVTEQSVDRLVEIVTVFCQEFATRMIQIEPMFPSGRGLTTHLASPESTAFIENFRKARQVAKSYGRDLTYSGARMGTISNVFCQAAGDSCAVTPDGIITSCYETLDANDDLADLFMYGHFDREQRRMVVDDERRARLLGLTVQNKPYCSRCFCKWHCAGDCPAKSARAGGQLRPQAADRCHINRELTKDQLLDALAEWDALAADPLESGVQ